MEYLITIYNDAEIGRMFDEDATDDIDAAHEALQRELRASGELVDTNVLSDVEARVVRVEDGQVVVEEGRYSANGIWAGGFYRVDCADLDRATAIAARFVEARWSPIEVRRID